MPEEPKGPRRRPRGRRRGGPPRPQQAPAQPERPASRSERPARGARGRPSGAREDRRGTTRDSRLAPRDAEAFDRTRRGRRGGRGRTLRAADEVRTGTPCVILLDAREGEPDRSGAPAVFEGYFDFETGDPRRPGSGIPRLRVGDERLWGFECWWRVDTEKTGLTESDREEVETSKRLLRGLLRDARRSSRVLR